MNDKVKLTIYVPPELRRDLKVRAAQKGVTISGLVNFLIQKELDESSRTHRDDLK